MKKLEPEAVYLGKYKVGYRARKNGKEGIAFMKKNKEPYFVDTAEFLRIIANGPRIEL